MNFSHRFTVVLIHHLQALNLPQSPIHHRQIQFLLPRVFVSDEIFKDLENGKLGNQHCLYLSHHIINKVREEFIKNHGPGESLTSYLRQCLSLRPLSTDWCRHLLPHILC
ncbi:unnamed protein product [Lactuca saligna]|uniref:Uncharacterized protein n=1 Tax=Lactuca saligna TaxID=75948 RepID=A0AA35YMU7_LACSI|nr:unnamed protein product [Lactuca saligna]